MTDSKTLRERFEEKFLCPDGVFQKAEAQWMEFNKGHHRKTGSPFGIQFWPSEFFPQQQILSFLQSEIEAAERRRTEEIMDAIPREAPMSVFSFTLRGEELERYMRHKGWNECRSEMRESIRSKFLKNPEQ